MKGFIFFCRVIIKRIFAISILIFLSFSCYPSTITSIANGNWSSPATWENQILPTSTDSIVINTEVYFDIDVLINAGGSITINEGAKLWGKNKFEILCGGYLTCKGILCGYIFNITDGVVNNPGVIYARQGIYDVPCLTGFFNNNYIYVGLSAISSCFFNDEYNPAAKPNVFPNPFSTLLNVSIESNEVSEIIFYDITSRKYLEKQFVNSACLNTECLKKGLYFYVIKNKSGVIKKGKIYKQ